jgi:2-polyprenyl-6-methoxyphenol hydroxylase-like FAD-dependent oxidoreductase
MKAIIIGAGIGGLTTALALQSVGIETQIYEQGPILREAGAGISLWANAIDALDVLGLGEPLRSRSTPGLNGTLRTANGKVLQAASYDELARRFGAAMIVVHRADLLAMLAARVNPQTIYLNHRCTGFVQQSGKVTAQFANGETVDGDLLIGADGLGSVVRAQLFGDVPPRYAGYTAWRAVVRMDRAHTGTSETWGAGQRFGITQFVDGRAYWYATKNASPGEKFAQASVKQTLLGFFGEWHEPIRTLIEAAEETAILRNDIYDRDPLIKWSEGRVTLMGDAAHPMTPNLGQGACQAIEDALVLAVCLRKAADPSTGLLEYERRRIPRTTRIVLESRRIGVVGQWANPLLCWIRDTAFRAIPGRLTIRHMDALAGYRVLTPDDGALISKE